MAGAALRDFIHLDFDRVRSLAAQLGDATAGGAAAPQLTNDPSDRTERERLLLHIEPALLAGAVSFDADFDFNRWTPDAFRDGQIVRATGRFRLMDFGWLSTALGGLPAVLRRMSKIEMETLKNSEQGRRMSKSQLQQRSQDNQSAIARVEEYKADELGDTIRRLYGDVVRVKVRPSPEQHPRAVLIGSAYSHHFYDSPAALSQKYGLEVDAGWTVLGQLNAPGAAATAAAAPLPIPTGNQMEDAFEQIALLMNNAFKMANAPAFPALSFTPLAIYRTTTAAPTMASQP